MKNFGQLWTLLLAAGGTEREASSLLGSVVNRAARAAHRDRVWAVVTQQDRRELKGPLWFLPASNFVVLPERGSTIYGIVMGLLRILQRDPAARVVLVPEPKARNPDCSGIVAGSASELLRLIEGRVPDITAQVEAVARETNADAEAELNARLQGLDFYRDVLPQNEQRQELVS
jgi:hypothetical protein